MMNVRSIWRLGLAVVAGLLLMAPSCPQGENLNPWVPAVTETTTQRVVVIGDSLTKDSQPDALALWANEPNVSVSYNGVGATWVQDWLKAMGKVTPDDVVVVALGTNNLLNEAWNTGVTQQHVIEALTELSDARRVIWVNVNEYGAALHGPYIDQRAPWFNDFLDEQAASGQWPNLVVADWNTVSYGHDDWFKSTADTIHYDEDGRAAYGLFLHDGAVL